MKVGEIIVSIIETIIKIGIFIFLGVLIYRGALMAYDYGYRVFTEAPVSVGEGRIISVEVKDAMAAKALGEMLQQKGLIRDSKIFFIQEKLSEYRGKETPGIYDLSTAMTAEEMLAVMCLEPEEEEEEAPAVEIPADTEELYIAEDETGEGSAEGVEGAVSETDAPAAEPETPAAEPVQEAAPEPAAEEAPAAEPVPEETPEAPAQ